MNLVEAIKSGKRFRRKSWTNREFFDVNVSRLDLPVDAIIADDWEVEPYSPRYSVEECIGSLQLLRESSHDLTIAMIDSILFHLELRL